MMSWSTAVDDFAAIVADNAQSIAIRRGSAELPAQTVRIAGRRAGPRDVATDHAEERRGRVVVVGPLGFDVAVGDRFNDSAGELYRVTLVRTNRRAVVVAEAELVE